MATKPQTQAPAGHKAQAAARKPSKGTTTTTAQAPTTQAPTTQAPTVALRGGLAIASVTLTGKPYRVGAAHNQAWWQQCQAAVAAGKGAASVATLLQAGVPAIFVGYVVRRGYMQAA